MGMARTGMSAGWKYVNMAAGIDPYRCPQNPARMEEKTPQTAAPLGETTGETAAPEPKKPNRRLSILDIVKGIGWPW
jgi:hypothetical protein